MTDPAPADTAPAHEPHRVHVVHRLAHAIYGLIVLTAVVGDLSTHDDDLRTAMVLVGGGGLVLVIAHSYSQFVAAAATYTETPPRSVMLSTLVDQLALAIPAAIAVAVFALGEADVISADLAYGIVLGGSLATLFVLGLLMGLHHQKSRAWSFAVALGNLGLGLLIIGIEAAAAH